MLEPNTSFSTEDICQRLLTQPRGMVAMILGAVDTGKTTFVRDTLRAITAAGRSAALIDCDLGQGEVGPPGTIGAALASPETQIQSLRDLPVIGSYFIGAVSPANHTLDICVGAVQMMRAAKKQRPDLILVDTCGWVAGPAAHQFKRRLVELLYPQAVIAFARADELISLLSAFNHLKQPELWRIAVEPTIGRKTPAARATRRTARFAAALDSAQSLTFPWDQIDLLGTSLGQGTTLPAHVQQFISQSLRVPVMYAAQSADGLLYIVVNGERWDSSGLAALEEYFKTRALLVVPAQKFAHLLVGLVDSSGELLNLAVIERIDFTRRTLSVLTPCRRPAAVAQLWMGNLRLKIDGRAISQVKPGEL